MSRIAQDVWTRLACEQIEGETLWARRAAPSVTDRVLAALDADGQRHLLVLLCTGDAELNDSQSRGIGVETRELSGQGHDAGKYLDITCKDSAGHEAFDVVGGELVARLASGRETAPECVSRVLAKWRRFWGQIPAQMLSREQQLGLFGELWFLAVWLVPKVGPADGVMRWRGPYGARHDFEWTSRSVETKVTTSTRGLIHLINGIDQLMPPEQGDLLFFSLCVREEAGASNNLPALVAACRQTISGDGEASARFEAALLTAGYAAVHEEEYAKLRIRVVTERLFAVRDDFPRLTVAQLSMGIPPGVERVQYEINLTGFEHLCVARAVGEIADL